MGRDLVWLDDDFSYFKYARDRFYLERSNHANTMLYHVSPRVGLLAQDLVTIKIHRVTQFVTH